MAPRRSLDGGSLAVVRPLLGLHPSALREWNERQGLAWREDPTNAGPGARNALRRRLLALESRHADPVTALVEVAERARMRIERRSAEVRARLTQGRRVLVPGAGVGVPRPLVSDLEGEHLAAALRLLGTALAADAAGPWFTRRHLRACARALREGGAVDLPHGLTLRVTPARVWLLRRAPRLTTDVRLACELVERSRFDLEAFCRTAAPLTAALDADRLGPTPRLRIVEPGDRFVPLGRGGAQATVVTDWMRRRGIPRLARRGALVVEGASGIAWLPGVREDAGHAVTPATRRVAILRLEPQP